MLRFRKGKNKGYILIYVLIISSLCLSIVFGCYKMEFLRRENSIKMKKNALKVDKTQKCKEYLLTELDEYIYENVNNVTEEDIKNYFSAVNGFSLTYEQCCVKYNKDKNYFLVEYYINNKFYKEEFYQYKVNGTSIIYGCIDYSYAKGVLN